MQRAAKDIVKALHGSSSRWRASSATLLSPFRTHHRDRVFIKQISHFVSGPVATFGTPAKRVEANPRAHGIGGLLQKSSSYCGGSVRCLSGSEAGGEQSERAKSKFLEREIMIRETQKAVRQMYKEGMYQVNCGTCVGNRLLPYAAVHVACVGYDTVREMRRLLCCTSLRCYPDSVGRSAWLECELHGILYHLLCCLL